jgi:hypothetical protein
MLADVEMCEQKKVDGRGKQEEVRDCGLALQWQEAFRTQKFKTTHVETEPAWLHACRSAVVRRPSFLIMMRPSFLIMQLQVRETMNVAIHGGLVTIRQAAGLLNIGPLHAWITV